MFTLSSRHLFKGTGVWSDGGGARAGWTGVMGGTGWELWEGRRTERWKGRRTGVMGGGRTGGAGVMEGTYDRRGGSDGRGGGKDGKKQKPTRTAQVNEL